MEIVSAKPGYFLGKLVEMKVNRMILKTEYEKIESYVTIDGSIIRKLLRPSVDGNSNQSLAEATVPVGGKTLLHKHRITEEIYHVTEGRGIMTLGSEELGPKKEIPFVFRPELRTEFKT